MMEEQKMVKETMREELTVLSAQSPEELISGYAHGRHLAPREGEGERREERGTRKKGKNLMGREEEE